MDANDLTPEDQDGEMSWASLTPVERELLTALRDRRLFEVLVDELEPSPIVWVLKMWGVVHGVYPADPGKVRAPESEELAAWLSRREQRSHRPASPAP